MINKAFEQTTTLPHQRSEISEISLDFAAAARQRLGDGAERVKEYVAKEPLRALGIALGVGIILGCLIKRR